MKKRIRTIVLISCLVAGFCHFLLYAKSDDRKSGLYYGPHYAFWVMPPPGWVMDNKSAVSQGLQVVFYPEGETWANAPTFMYANKIYKNKEIITFEKAIESDVAQYKEGGKPKEIQDAPPLLTMDKKKAVIKYFLDDDKGNFSAVAYIDQTYIVALLVLNADNEDRFRKALPSFERLVKDYQYFSDKVKVDK